MDLVLKSCIINLIILLLHLSEMKFEKTYVVLVNYNNFEDTMKCLKSIEALKKNYRVILVDNNSLDDGISQIPESYSFVTLLRNKKNIGFGDANNMGIEYALSDNNCDSILILNNDTTLVSRCIEKLENAIQEKSVGIASPKILFTDNPRLVWYGGAEINWYRCSVKSPAFCVSSDSKIANKSRFVTFASGCAFLIKREVLETVGGFDKRFFMYVEDLELCLRVLRNNWKIKYVPEAIIYHRIQGSFRNEAEEFIPIDHPKNPRLPFFMYHLTRNRLLTMKMHARGVNAIKFWAFYPVYSFLKLIQYLIYGRTDVVKPFLSGIYDFIIGK